MLDIDADLSRLAAERRRFVMISGCSGGGKSTLLAALAARGYRTAGEPGRQIVREELFIGGEALPWVKPDRFLALVVSRAIRQLVEAGAAPGLTIFDRGLVDAYAGYRRSNAPIPPSIEVAVRRLPYAETVFLAPPWPEIFASDTERRHGYDEAVAEYEALVETYAALGYRPVTLPRTSVAERADFVMTRIGPPEAQASRAME